MTGTNFHVFPMCRDMQLSESLYYVCFVIAPVSFKRVGLLSKAFTEFLFEEVKGTSITRVNFPHSEISQNGINGVEESISEVLQNLQKIIFRSSTDKITRASICLRGPGPVLAKDIKLPPSVAIENLSEHILSLSGDIQFSMDLFLERNPELQEDSNWLTLNGSVIEKKNNSFHLHYDVIPVKRVKFLFHDVGRKSPGYAFCEIWTSGGVLPTDAFYEASNLLADFFNPFRKSEKETNFATNFWISQDIYLEKLYQERSKILNKLEAEKGIKAPFHSIYFSELQERLLVQTFNLLEEHNIKTIDDMLVARPFLWKFLNQGQLMELKMLFLELILEFIKKNI